MSTITLMAMSTNTNLAPLCSIVDIHNYLSIGTVPLDLKRRRTGCSDLTNFLVP